MARTGYSISYFSNDVMKTVHKGQLVQVRFKGDKETDGKPYWQYGVVGHIYDNRYVVLTEYGIKIMYNVNEEETKGSEGFISGSTQVVPLTIGGRPVMARKTLFGKYKYPIR